MDLTDAIKLENALAKTQAEAEVALKAAINAVSAVRKIRAAAKFGNLRDLRKTIDMAEQSIGKLGEEFNKTRESWKFDEDTYLANRFFITELLEQADRIGLKLFEQDDRLYCYPFIIRVLPSDRQIMIDKTREKRLRPSVLAKLLKQEQDKPPRFRPEPFLECLFGAYERIVSQKGKDAIGNSPVVKLRDIYELLTLLPGQQKEYSLQEFSRDIYLLDRSGVTRTKRGFRLNLHPPGRMRNPIVIIADDGTKKRYYGISFATA
jgi:HAMP domain-containing protein